MDLDCGYLRSAPGIVTMICPVLAQFLLQLRYLRYRTLADIIGIWPSKMRMFLIFDLIINNGMFILVCLRKTATMQGWPKRGSCTVFTEHVLENIEQQYNDLYQRFACWCQLAESVLVLLLIMIPNKCFPKLDELMSERPGDAVLIWSHSSAGFLTMACWVIELQYTVVMWTLD